MDVGRRELGEEGELRKVVTSEGLGIGERCHLRLLPASLIFVYSRLHLFITADHETAQALSKADLGRSTFL